jgi:hypothetical protein
MTENLYTLNKTIKNINTSMFFWGNKSWIDMKNFWSFI